MKLSKPASEQWAHLINLPKDDARGEAIRQEFVTAWTKSNVTDLRVEAVLDIVPMIGNMDAHNRYKKYISSQRGGDEYINEKILYHGTHQNCDAIFGEGDGAMCGLGDCGVCGLITTGFDVNKIGKNVRKETFQRLGDGFYFCPHSSKAHYYSKFAKKPHRYVSKRYTQVILRCAVVLGKTYNTQHQMRGGRQDLPSGYDSVYAGVGTCGGRGHGALNYPEYCVYDPDSVLPVNYILYSYTSTNEF